MSQASRGADLLFTELADAARFSQDWKESVEEQEEVRERVQKQLDALDDLCARISKAFDGLYLDPVDSEGLSRKITEFSNLAIQQARERVKAKLKETLSELAAEARSHELRAKRALESYLAATPLPVNDQEISIGLTDSSYSARAEYKCAGDIEYEFLLNAASSPHFRGELAFGRLRKGVKLPVRLGRTWLRKEHVPDYEKLDDFALTKARASKNHLEASFVDEESGSSVGIVYSSSGADAFVTVEYSDDNGKVDVTGEASLSKYLDLHVMKAASGKLLEAMLGLTQDKLQLTKLESSGEDVLSTLDLLGFMQRVVYTVVQSKDAMESMRKVNPKLAMERLKLLGPSGTKMIEALGLSSRGSK